MTLLEKWLDQGCSPKNIERKLKTLLRNPHWTEFFCFDDRDICITYCFSRRHMCNELELYDIPYISSVYNEESALQIIKKCIEENAYQIADWFSKPEKLMSFLCVGDEPVGIVRLQKESEFTPSFTALITLKKCGHSNRNRSGFFVESIVPIPEIKV